MGKFDYKKWVTENKYGKQQLNEVQTFECNGPCDRCQDNCGPGEISTLDRMSPGSNSVRLCYCASGQTAHTPGRGATRGKTAQTPSIKAKPGLRESKKIFNKSSLKKLIRESIKEIIVEQTATQCADITSQNMGAGVGYFFSCCEMGYFPNNPGNINDAQCKMHLDYGIITYGLTPQEVTNCCDPNWGTGGGDGDCDDPLWVGMPAPNKMEYCNRCSETGGGIAVNGSFPVNLMAGAPYYQADPNGLNYCKCCDDGSGGDMDCDNPEWVAQNPGAARKCFICQQAPAPCEQISNIPGMTVAIAQGMGLNLYNDQASCNAQTECGPGTSGNRCDQMTQGVYDPDDPNHNDGWGMGCWFCHPEEGHPDFPGCTMITTPMSQWNAYNAYVAGTTGIYTTNAACQADPITKCGDEDPVEMIKCMCCDGNQPISMATEVPASQGCPGSYPGYTNCLLHPMSGGTIPKNYCKKIVEPVDTPIDDVEPMPMVKPVGSDREKRALREAILKLLKK